MKYSTAVLLALAFSSTNALTIKSRLTQDDATTVDTTTYGEEDNGSHGDFKEAIHAWMEDLPEGVTDKIHEHIGSWGDFDLENLDLENVDMQKVGEIKSKLVSKLGSKIPSSKKALLKSAWSKVKSHFAGEKGDGEATEEEVPVTERRAKQSSLHGPPSLGPSSIVSSTVRAQQDEGATEDATEDYGTDGAYGEEDDHHWTDHLDDVDWENFDWDAVPSKIMDHVEEHHGDVDWDNVTLEDVKDHIQDNMSSEMQSHVRSFLHSHMGGEDEEGEGFGGDHSKGSHSHGSHSGRGGDHSGRGGDHSGRGGDHGFGGDDTAEDAPATEEGATA